MMIFRKRKRTVDRQNLQRQARGKPFEELESRRVMFATSLLEATSFGDLCLTANHGEHGDFALYHSDHLDSDHLDSDHFLMHDDFGELYRDHGFNLTGILDRDQPASGGGSDMYAFSGEAYGTIPALHSNAAATVKIYLDFDGNFESVWGSYSNVTTPVFDTDGNSGAFSATEINKIREIWERVAEDFAPFNVDVTTVNPGDFSNGKAVLVSIGGNGGWIGNYGGVAYVNSFTNSLSNTVYVFTANLGNNAKYIAEAASHEVGHALGLYHQSEYNASGAKVADYYAGTGNWAPIMGVGYYREQSTWHNGPNSHGAQSYQDDMALISRAANGFGYRQDDYGSSLNSPTAANFVNGQLTVSGTIEQITDWDVFSFNVQSNTSVALDVDVAALGSNLDARIDLYNSAGQLVLASNPANRFDVSVSAQLAADNYRLVVRGSGNYGDVGQYAVNMVVINSAPNLQPLSDVVMAHSASPRNVTLQATDNDGDTVSFSAQISYTDPLQKLAYDLDQQHGLFLSTSDYYNQRGLQEKYLQGNGGQWYYMLPTGEFFQWGGSVAASTKLATLNASYHSSLAKLHSAQVPTSVPFAGTWQIANNVLTIDPTNGTTGTYEVRVTAADAYASDTEIFTLQVINAAPSLSAIADQSMRSSQNQLAVLLSASDSDGDAVVLSATARANDPIGSLAYQLKQQHGFYAASSDYYNQRGLQEKYFQGTGETWYYMLPTGATYAWGGSVAASTLLGTLDGSYHASLAKLFTAQNVNQPLANVALSVVGQTLTIDPANGYVGTFIVDVSATDGVAAAARSFRVDVTNNAPSLTAIADQTMATSQDTLAVQLAASDSDGDAIQFSAEARGGDPIARSAYQLKQQHGFVSAGSDYYNQRGIQEKYFQGNGGSWFYMLPSGAIYSWGGSIAASTLLGTLNSSYYQNLNNLYNAPAVNESVTDVGLQVNGSTLIINPNPGYTGQFEVVVRATDGATSVSTLFKVNVINHAPTITPVANQTMATSQNTLVINLAASDSDGDSVQFSAVARGGDPVALLAYQLKQQHGFISAGHDYYNQRGLQERYFQGNGGNWYYMFPTGAVYAWGGSVAASTHLGTLDSSYHASLSKLMNAPAVDTTVSGVTLSVVGNTLTLDPAANYTGTFDVQVSATDGMATSTSAFSVTVVNRAPALTPMANRSMPTSQDTLVVNLSASDADGDAIQFSALARGGDPIARQAYELKQQYGFYFSGSDYYNQRGIQEKYFQGSAGKWYYMLPTGAIYSWGGSVAASTLLATLDSTYHATLSKVYNAQPVDTNVAGVTLSVVGNTLTINPNANYTGVFDVHVAATDGMATTTSVFTVSVVNNAPTIQPVQNVGISPSQDSVIVSLTGSDADGDAITWSAQILPADSAAVLAYQLKQQHGFYSAGSDYYNQRGIQEKYFQGNGGNWYYMLPTGATYAWGGSIAASTLIGTLDNSYFTNLSRLYNAQAVSDPSSQVVVSLNGNQLTIDPANGYTGSFQVRVSASDGIAATNTSIAVQVQNQAPTLAAIADQTLSSTDDFRNITLTTADADGDAITLTASVTANDSTALLAYQLRQQHGFRSAGSTYYNQRGLQEKYFQGNNDAWYFMFPDGSTYAWGGTVAASPLLGKLDGTYFADLNKLYNAPHVANPANNVSATIQGNVLTVNPEQGYTGSFRVSVNATAGAHTTTRTFQVTVGDVAPPSGATIAMTMSMESAGSGTTDRYPPSTSLLVYPAGAPDYVLPPTTPMNASSSLNSRRNDVSARPDSTSLRPVAVDATLSRWSKGSSFGLTTPSREAAYHDLSSRSARAIPPRLDTGDSEPQGENSQGDPAEELDDAEERVRSLTLLGWESQPPRDVEQIEELFDALDVAFSSLED